MNKIAFKSGSLLIGVTIGLGSLAPITADATARFQATPDARFKTVAVTSVADTAGPRVPSYVSNIAGSKVKVKIEQKDTPTKYRKLVQRGDTSIRCKWTTYKCDEGYVTASWSLHDDRCVKIGTTKRKVKANQRVRVAKTSSVAVKWYPIGDCGDNPWLSVARF